MGTSPHNHNGHSSFAESRKIGNALSGLDRASVTVADVLLTYWPIQKYPLLVVKEFDVPT